MSLYILIKPPCLVHLLPWWINWYPGSCNNDKSESLEVDVSCRQISPKYRPWDARLSITRNRLSNFVLTLCIFDVSIRNSIWLFWNIDWISDISIYCEWQKFVICYFMFRINKSWQHMVKIIFRTSQVSIKMACTLFSNYHSTITHKRQSDNPGFITWICNWESKIHCHASQQIRRVWTINQNHTNISYIENKTFWWSVNWEVGGRLVRMLTRDGNKI